MKILVLTSSYPRFSGDVAGRFVAEWVNYLAGLGHQFRVLTWRDASGRRRPPTAGFDGPGVIRVPYAPPGLETLFYGAGAPENLREQPLRGLLAAPAVAAMAVQCIGQVRRFDPDLIVGHWMVPAGLLARLVGDALGAVSLVIGHSGGVHLLDNLWEPIGAILADAVAAGPTTVPSGPLAEKFASLLAVDRQAPMVLPMGFEPPDASKSAPNCPRDSRRADWLCMGRLVDIKGIDLAIRAFSRAAPAAATLHVAGDGPRRRNLKVLASRLGARVEFHGCVSGERRRQIWRRCGYALFASRQLDSGRHEGLPVSFLEAASRGLVPLCGPIPGLGSYLVDRGVQQVRNRRLSAWADAIDRLAGLSESRYAELADRQMAAVAELAWPQLIERWERLIRRLCMLGNGSCL